jgi:hypothetical protein
VGLHRDLVMQFPFERAPMLLGSAAVISLEPVMIPVVLQGSRTKRTGSSGARRHSAAIAAKAGFAQNSPKSPSLSTILRGLILGRITGHD